MSGPDYMTPGDRRALAAASETPARRADRAEGRRLERADVVKYIRDWATPMCSVNEQWARDLLFEIADCIESGEHADEAET